MRTVRGIVRLGEAQSIPMRRVGECPILDAMLKIHVSFVQIRVQLAVGGSKRQNGGVPGGWGLFRLKVTEGYDF